MKLSRRVWALFVGTIGAIAIVAASYIRPEDCKVYPYGAPPGGYGFWANGGGIAAAAAWGFTFAALYRYLAKPSLRPVHRYLEAFVFGLFGAILMVLLTVPAGGRCLGN